MPWTTYTLAMLLFSVVTLVITYAVLRWQAFLPLNPMHFGDAKNAPSYGTAMTPDLAFNTAASFTTNTNWQAYSGENTMSYFSQMVGLASHNFFSAATGIAIAIALVRGLGRRSAASIGNFWVDLTRATLYVLLPLCLVYALFLCSAGRHSELPRLPNSDRRWKAARRSFPAGRLPRRKRSRCWGRTAAGR